MYTFVHVSMYVGTHIACMYVFTWVNRYLRDLIRLPSSATFLRPLRSLDRHDLFVPRARTSMAQTRAFAIIGPLRIWPFENFEPTPSFYMIHFINWSAKCLLSFSEDCSLGLSHWKRL